MEKDALMLAPNYYDFRLQAGSGAVDSGAVVTNVTDDIVGTTRPQGSGWDIGAY